ncbi:MAG: electron transfer flavoprotein subunit alpha/FixB family protein [Chitinophagales bacterium]|jgi:electron transfer flavoprotein alpha subunit|nr:electron transfer flavoprotein subunit alpha/FixB family protein [Chitinophagales bacterium]
MSSILVFIESQNNQIKKASLEALTYARAHANAANTSVFALADGHLSSEVLSQLGQYGADKIITLTDDRLNNFDSKAYAYMIAEVAKTNACDVVVISYNICGKAIAGRVAKLLNAGLVAGAIDTPDTSNGFVVKKGVFSGKAFAYVRINTNNKVIALTPNAYKTEACPKAGAIEAGNLNVPAEQFSVKVKDTQRSSGKIPLTEAELVVSGGRGLKGPENWGMLEETAQLLNAATACSRAVADVHWRPHEEHVGQTGITIRPNLYIAVGISGAIQHLAGVNQSKTIVVINTDKEAPFFSAADYGIVGDAFEVVPKLNAAIKKFKGQ